VTAGEEEIGARVDALASAYDGNDFVAAVQGLAEELGPEARPVLQQILLERAAEEEGFQKAVRRRFAERGWIRRTLDRFEGTWRDERADAVASAVKAGEAGRSELAGEMERLRAEPGKAALVLDELSRHESPEVRAWVPGAAAELLGDGGARLVISMTRDRDPEVRDVAVRTAIRLDPEKALAIAPDLRRRLHAKEEADRIAATWALAELGDERALATFDDRAEHADEARERSAARAAALVLRNDGAAIAAGLREHEHDDVPALAAAARILGTEEALGALRESAEGAPDELCRAVSRAELARLAEEADGGP
jgi:HEAT repeats